MENQSGNRNSYIIIHLLAVTLCLFLIGACKEKDLADPMKKIVYQGILQGLKNDHPRLLLTDERLTELKNLSATDAQLKKYAYAVLSQADKDLVKAPIQYILIGPRLLDKSKECLSRVYNLAFAYRWTGNIIYLQAAISNMKTVCAFPDWNPSHFLDVGEMTHAVAIGYDWLYNDMDQETRDLIRSKIISMGLDEGRKAYTLSTYPYKWWTKDSFNWNQVCNSGLMIGALAIAESDTAFASLMISNAVKNLPYAIKTYGPDGAWGEGPGYWDYATSYTAYGISALETALGNTFGLTIIAGLSAAGYFPMYTTGPTGYFLNYADAGEKSKLGAPQSEMWLASAFHDNVLSDFVEDQLKTRTANIFHVIWYRPYSSSSYSRSLDKFFGGGVELFLARSSWTDPEALFIGAKGGYNKVNHAHLDIGNFELDALGVRWVRDLGSDDYNLPGYFDGGSPTSPRWTYYRLNSFSHNVPLLGGKNQALDGTSTFTRKSTGTSTPFAILNFSTAYKEFATSAMRGFMLQDNRKVAIVQDEFILSKACDISFGITTDATIQLADSQNAILTQNSRKVNVKILSPANAAFYVESAEQTAPQKLNTGVKRLLAKIPSQTGTVTVTVMFAPQWGGVENIFTWQPIPLSQW
jgi:hypothetical protein